MSPSFLHFFYLALFNKTVSQNYTVAYPIEEAKGRIRAYLLETKRFTPSYFKKPNKDYFGRFSGLECRRITIQKIHRPKLFTTNIQQRLGSQLIAKCYLTPNESETKISVKFKSHSSYIIWGLYAGMISLTGILLFITSIGNTFSFKAMMIMTGGLLFFATLQAFISAFYLQKDFRTFNSLLLEL